MEGRGVYNLFVGDTSACSLLKISLSQSRYTSLAGWLAHRKHCGRCKQVAQYRAVFAPELAIPLDTLFPAASSSHDSPGKLRTKWNGERFTSPHELEQILPTVERTSCRFVNEKYLSRYDF